MRSRKRPLTRKELQNEADRILARAGWEQSSDDALGRPPHLLHSVRPTDVKPDEGGPWRDGSMIVAASPDPILEHTQPAPPERILWRGIGPNGRPCEIVEAGEARIHWIYVMRGTGQFASRAREWIFEGQESRIRDIQRRLLLTQTYFAHWLRETNPHARKVERSSEIACWFIAEASGCLVYRGRNLSPDAYGAFLASDRYRRIQDGVGTEHGTPSRHDGRPGAVIATAAAFKVRAAVVTRIHADLRRFIESPLYREKLARYEALGPNTHLL